MGRDSQGTITEPAIGSNTRYSLRFGPSSKVHILGTVPYCALQVVDSGNSWHPRIATFFNLLYHDAWAKQAASDRLVCNESITDNPTYKRVDACGGREAPLDLWQLNHLFSKGILPAHHALPKSLWILHFCQGSYQVRVRLYGIRRNN